MESSWELFEKKGGDYAGVNITVTKDGKLDVKTTVTNDDEVVEA